MPWQGPATPEGYAGTRGKGMETIGDYIEAVWWCFVLPAVQYIDEHWSFFSPFFAVAAAVACVCAVLRVFSDGEYR